MFAFGLSGGVTGGVSAFGENNPGYYGGSGTLTVTANGNTASLSPPTVPAAGSFTMPLTTQVVDLML